ncbi:MAG: EAL domain-containing protein [Hyphomicrobiaceae bacterium]
MNGPPPTSGLGAAASPVDDLAMPESDGAPRAMSRPGSTAWPRVVPKSPTSPLDLDTMQNLIEQLAGQLDQEPVAPDAAAHPAQTSQVTQAARPATSERMPTPSALTAAGSSRVPSDDTASERDRTPFGHLALIAEAVEASRMDVLLDPILGLSDRRARHFELSVRLLTETGDSLEEAQYAPVAGGAGLLGRIDAEKLNRAADVLQRLRARGSAASLFSTVAGESLSDENFATAFADVLAAEEGNASRLVLTFQQAEARNFTDAHWRAIADMSRIGLKFALTGVTDLDMDFEVLKRHGFDFIKLDARVFLDGLPTPTGVVPASDICRHFAGIGLGLIVGGIIEEKDLARILGFGVLLGQGALFGGPRSVELERERRAA